MDGNDSGMEKSKVGFSFAITGEGNEEEECANMENCSAADQATKFDADEYLRAFYSSPTHDTAMHVVLFFLPGIIYWLPETITTLLDLGAGPTVYVPIVFRKRAIQLYTSDYSITNCEELRSWMNNCSSFKWDEICSWIAAIECSRETSSQMEQSAREKLQAVLKVDLHSDQTVQAIYCTKRELSHRVTIPEQFQLVVTIFCLEYSCETLSGYCEAVSNAVRLIEPGGYLIQGGVLNAEDYYFGGRRYTCCKLTREQVMETLRSNNLASQNGVNFKWFERDDVFLLLAKKL